MDKTALLVLADRSVPELAMLERMPVSATVGTTLREIEPGAANAEVILSWPGHRDLLEHIWEDLLRLRWIHCMWAGLDDFFFPALRESPLPVTNARGVFSESLAEFVMAAVLFFAKDLRRMIRNQAAATWEPFDVEEISRQTFGIIGYGSIGAAIARRAKAMGMRVLGLRRGADGSSPDPLADEVFSPQGKLEMIRRCDYLALAAPLTPETRGILGAGEIEAMKPHAVVINVGRGSLIDEPALVKALQEGRIRGAALDVFETEPLPPGHPFYRLENVLLSPHCADHTPTWLQDAMELFGDNLDRYRKGQPLRNVVDKRRGY